MKSINQKLILVGVFALGIFSSCKKTCTINVDESKSYHSQNYHIVDPDLGLFNDGDTTKARIVIENVDVFSSLKLERITAEEATKKQPAGIYRTVERNGKDVYVPIDQITLERFAMREESEAQATEPLIACVERFDVYFNRSEAPPFDGYNHSEHYKTSEHLIASYAVKDSSISVGPWGSGLLAAFDFDVNGLNLAPLLFENPISYLEIVATFKKIPDDVRVFSYNFAVSCKGSFEGKCK